MNIKYYGNHFVNGACKCNENMRVESESACNITGDIHTNNTGIGISK